APGGGPAVREEAASHEQIRIDGLHDASAFALPREGGRDLHSRLQYRIRQRPLPLRMRLDPVLLGGLAAATVVYGIVTASLVLLFGSGFTAGWSARSLPDRRLLEKVRPGPRPAAFFGAG